MIQSEDFKSKHRLSGKDFTRNRILGFYDLVVCQIQGFVKTLSVELHNMMGSLNKNEAGYSKQAFSKARQKLRHSAFIDLNDVFLQQYYAPANEFKKFRGEYLLLAIDGSLCQLPESGAVISHFGTWKNQNGEGMAMGRASVMYDVLNHLVLDSRLAACTQDEHSLYDLHMASESRYQNQTGGIPKIYLMDRNYPSFKKIIELNRQKCLFVMRCKAKHCNEIEVFSASGKEEEIINIDLTSHSRRNNPSVKSVKDCPDSVEVRIARILLPCGEYEYLLTNTDFDIAALYRLYGLRWGVETFYGGIKGTMELENFSSALVEGVLQDFHGKILTCNLMELFIQEAQKKVDVENKEKNNKYQYIINKNVARGLLRDKVARLVFNDEITTEEIDVLIGLVKKHKVAVIPNRNPKRNKEKRRGRRKFFIHQRKAL